MPRKPRPRFISRDWIDQEHDLRAITGRGSALSQSQHAEVNARYPGCTEQLCCQCGEPMGAADYDDEPLCSECRERIENELDQQFREERS